MLTYYVDKNKKDFPKQNLTVVRVENTVWEDLGFAQHHYLTAEMNKGAKGLLFCNEGVPCAFVAILNSPRKGLPHDMSLSRVVINPDFQGLGLAKIIDFCGGIVKSMGEDYRLCIKTVHEKMGKHLENSKVWSASNTNGLQRSENVKVESSNKYKNRLARKSFCYYYSGEAIKGYEELLLPIGDLRRKHGT